MTLRFTVSLLFVLLPLLRLPAADEPSAATAATPSEIPADEELAAEIEKERKTAERFLALLERNPREGTSLDKAYGFFVEQGKLDELVATYRDRVAKNDADGTAWMLLGLIEARRGNDGPSIEALAKGSERRAQDPMAAYYLARAYSVAGRSDEAIAAFEQAISRKPARADLPPIFSELGRLHQRVGRTEEAAKVWDRLEAAFPDDLRVKAEIAAILEEEGQTELALARYEALAKADADEYRKVTHAFKAASLKARLGKRDEAIRGFEKLLAGLNPDNWMHREARRGIEEVFLRTDDDDGLAAYYEGWIKKNPEDVSAMTRLADLLDELGRSADARGWFDKATKLAPSDGRLRRAYIEALRRGNKNAEAVAQFEALDKASPNDPDVIRDWGTVYLEDKSLAEADRKAKAAAVWKRLPAAKPNDPVVTAQVADWFRQAGIADEALALYAKAVALAPEDARYLEYLGEYQHQLGKKEEAVATWRKLAEGKSKSAPNLVRLAEVLSGFGYKEEAVAAFREADGLALEFGDRLRFADLLRDREQYDASLEEVAKAESLAESDEERQNALLARIETDQAADRLAARVEQLRKKSAEAPSAQASLTLALYLDASRDSAAAAQAARDAVERDPRSIPAQATLARLAGSAGQLDESADAFRRLAALDRRGRTEYLKQVADLEQRLGRSDAALATAREVLASAPGSPEAYSFYADLCFRLGRTDDGLDALRRASRLAPTDPGPTLALAAALAEQFKTGEATELYWQAFGKADAFDDKAMIVARLAELYVRQDRLDELVKRLTQPEAGDDRESGLLVAEAYVATGDAGRAVETLQKLLAESPRDLRLLGKLSQLAERDRDLETALRYQKEIVALSPEDRAEKSRLAQLYLASDSGDAGSEFFDELVEGGLDPTETLSLLDALLGAGKYADAARLADRRLRDAPDDWELLYRKAFAEVKQEGRQTQAAEAFTRLLALNVADDAESVKLAAMRKRTGPPSPTAATSSAAAQRMLASYPKVLQRSSSASQIQVAFGMLPADLMRQMAQSRSRNPLWTPAEYGSARMAALMWLGHRGPDAEGLRRKLSGAARSPTNATPRELWDSYYFLSSNPGTMPERGAPLAETMKRLAEVGGADGAWLYLTRLPAGRSTQMVMTSSGPVVVTASGTVLRGGEAGAASPPLPAEEIELMLRCFEKVRHTDAGSYGARFATNVAQQLNNAGRKEEANAIIRQVIEQEADDPASLSYLVTMATSTGDSDTTLAVYDRIEKLPPDKLASLTVRPDGLTRLMRTLWDEGKRDEALALLDRQFALARRRLEAPKPPGGRPASSSATAAMLGQPVFVSGAVSRRGFALNLWKSAGTQQGVAETTEPNEYLGISELTVLRNAYEFHDEKQVVEELVAHLSKKSEGVAGPQAALLHLSLGAIRSWQGNGDAMIEATRTASDAVPGDYELRLSLARQLKERGRGDEALDLLDEVEPLDGDQLRERELLVLDLAVERARIDRAKTAASRLYGMRLDANQQIRLANVMGQVGMTEQADSLLARLRTQRGSTPSTQIDLLRHYRGKGETDVAVEIAREIIRRYKPSTMTGRPAGSRTADDIYREEAVKTLKDAGQLDTLISEARRQAERAPNSIEAQRQLADYLMAVGKAEEAVGALKSFSSRRPEDADLKYELASRVAAMGRTGDAVDLYVAAVNAKPELLSRNFYDIQRTFQQANRSADMLRLIREIDFSKGGDLRYAISALSDEMSMNQVQPAALDTLDALLKKYPDRANEILPQIRNREVWADERISGAALEFIRTEGNKLTWNEAGNYSSISSGGQINAFFNNVVAAAKGKGAGKGDGRFLTAVAELAAKHPDWQPGQALLAVMEADAGRIEEARGRLRKLLDDKSAPVPAQGAWAVAVELGRLEPLRDVAIGFAELAAESNTRIGSDFDFSPQSLLVRLYGEAGRAEDARSLLLTKALEPSANRSSDPSYQASSELRSYAGVADKLRELGYPIDSLRVYDRYVNDPVRILAATRQRGLPDARFEEGRRKAVAAIDAPNVARFLAAAAKEKPNKSAPALDLVLTLNGTELSAMTVDSVIAVALANALATDGTVKPLPVPSSAPPAPADGPDQIDRTYRPAGRPPQPMPAPAPPAAPVGASGSAETVAEIRASVATLAERRPEDVSVQTLAALVAFTAGEIDAAKAAAERASSLVDGAATKSGPAGNSPPSALGLWLLARESAKHEGARSLASDLADKALATARRMPDNRWALAMLRERGQQAIDAGDRAGAERAWSEALELILPREQAHPAGAPKAVPRSSPLRRGIDSVPTGRTTSGIVPSSPLSLGRGAGGEGVPSTTVAHPNPMTREGFGVPWWPDTPYRVPDSENRATLSVAAGPPTAAVVAGSPDPATRPTAGLPARSRERRLLLLSPSPRRPLATLLTLALLCQAPEADAAADAAEEAADAAAAKAKPAAPPVANLSQATQALQLAEIAARNGLTELSLRAVRESLGGGRPLNIVPADLGIVRVLSSTRTADVNDAAQVEQQMIEPLLRLDAAWREKGADPVAVYETLSEIVLPPARPTEVFLYARPLADARTGVADDAAPESAGRMLVSWAAKAGRIDELSRRLTDRPVASASGLAVYALRVLAAYEGGDPAVARIALDALAKRAAAAASLQYSELACHAALPGLSRPETADAAVAALSAIAPRLAESGNEQPYGRIMLRIADHEFERGRADAGERRLGEYVAALNGVYSRYSGDYALYRRREVLLTVARRLARHGRAATALERLGEATDLQTNRYGGSSASTAFFVAGLVRDLMADKSPDAYDRLRAWTLPAGERKAVRLLAEITSSDLPPAEFGLPPDPAETAFGPGRVPIVTGTAAALAELAKRGGKLAELVAEADRLATEGIKGAAELSILAHVGAVTGGEVADRFGKVVDEFVATPTQQLDFTGPTYPNLVLLAHVAAGDPALRPTAARLAAKLVEQSRGKGHALFAAALFVEAECAAFDAGLAPEEVLTRDHFGLWRVARIPRAQDLALPRVPAVWAVREGVARHVAGSETDPLVFRYPLTGSFDLVAEAFDDSSAEGHLGFGGLTYEQYSWAQKSGVFEIARYGQGERPLPGLRKGDYARVRIEVRPGSTRCLIDDREVHVDRSPSASSPFLVLSALFGRSTWYRNVRIEGDPVIPGEVRLVDAERLDGWNENLFGESKPARPGVDKPRDEPGPAADPVWSVAGGVVAAKPRPPGFRQSLLTHHRPLWDGETVEYEFLHGEGNGVAHPALGRLAFLLEPEGVRLHWTTGENEFASAGLATDNAVDAPGHRRRPDALPLKPEDWNAVRLSVAASTLRIELNGELVFERPLEESDSRLFGFYRDARQGVKVRNVLLRGDWPEKLGDATKSSLLESTTVAENPDVTRYERALITEKHLKR